MPLVANVMYWAVALGFIGFLILTLYKLSTVDLSGLICELDGKKASLSRFQFLIFTFVVAGVFVVLCLDSGTFVEIPGEVLGLIGVSGGSFVVSKGISKGKAADGPPVPTPSP